MLIQQITVLCFVSSYATALLLEIIQAVWPRKVQRLGALFLGVASLVTHGLYLAFHPPWLTSPQGSLLFLAFILAVFSIFGSIHYRRLAWGIFVLPLVLGLIALAELVGKNSPETSSWPGMGSFQGVRFWALVHGGLVLLASVGVCVGFLASIMYLLQVERLKAKVLPGQGLRLLSLERLEEINHRAINLAFPLLSAGVLVGGALMIHHADQFAGWTDLKVWGTLVLWIVFALLLYLRYGYHLRGRRVAFLTIVAFVLLLFTLVSSHTGVQGGAR